MYFFYGKLGYENDKMILEYTDENENIRKITDLKTYIRST